MSNQNSKPTNYKDYMESYEWNYRVLDLADFIERKIREEESDPRRGRRSHPWHYFMLYCQAQSLNQRVIRKMIEYSLGQTFECEADLIRHHKFQRLPIYFSVPPNFIENF